MKEKEIRVLKVEPHDNPKETTLKNELSALQEAVGGLIEFVSLDSDNSIEILCNEEGKLIGLEPNRRVYNDVIVGTFYVVKCNDDGDCISLSDNEIEFYKKRFEQPEDISAEEVENTLRYGIEII